jgi:hypothetical protein
LERFFPVWRCPITQIPNLPRNSHENPRPYDTLFHVER